MRRIILTAVAATAALVTAGLALATLNASGVSATTATFSAAKERSETRTCTGDGDTYEITNGRYVGTVDFADPNSDLDGPLRIQVRTVLNKTDGVGYVEGSFRIKDDDRRGHGKFVGVLDGSGSVDGFVQGRVNRKHAVLLGGMSAKFSADGGFTEGKLGNSTSALPAVLVGRPCKNSKPAPVAVRLVVKGTVSALDSAKITVDPRDKTAAQTCEIKEGTSPSLGDVKLGSEVEMGCGLVDGKMTLLKLKKHR
ncbi:MAG: hypothetical protein ACXWZP_00740 [Gaiellaceae bacterium]